MAELKPCPFCGNKENISHIEGCTEAIKGITPMMIENAQLHITHAVNRWIPCSELMPEKHIEVLAYSPFWGKAVVAMWGGEFWLEQWTDDDLQQSEITHWMPLPEPPESEVQHEA